jgi:putative flippase GtrA
MRVFFKAQLASLTATAIDFLVTILLVNLFGFYPVPASAIGTITGGAVYFRMGRNWVFEAAQGPGSEQAVKYIAVWIVYLLLNTGFLYLITRYTGVNYILAKVGVAITMSVSYNFVLHKKFVFK